MDNIDVFNRIVVVVFQALHQAFPRPVTLAAREIRQQAEIPDDDWWEANHGTRGNSAGAAIVWLNDEGFLRYSAPTSDGSMFAGAVLTAKGLAILNRIPISIETRSTLGERLKDLTSTATREAVSAFVRMLIEP
jgi:hypothetical protein